MGALERWKRSRLGLRLSRTPEAEPTEESPAPPEEEPSGSREPRDEPAEEDPPSRPKRKAKLTKWVEKRAHRVVSSIYEARADDLEDRARRVVSSAYSEKADDLEERAVRAMRRAIAEESDRIKEAIEHGVEVKKREVRLSLIVLVVAALVYLALYLLQQSGRA